MSKIERGQFSDFLRRYLGMAGVSDVAGELAPEISPVFVLEAERPEWEWLKGAKLMAHATQVPALAGNLAAVRYRNPANSGVVAVFTHLVAGNLELTGPTATLISVTQGAQAADLATVSGTVPRDTRQTTMASAIVASFGYAAIGGLRFDLAVIESNTSWQFFRRSPFVLTPGNALNLALSTNNFELDVSAAWLEKRFDELERL